jgi:hypothetical protein
MNDLIAWLHAQLDEDERIAHEATPGSWIDQGQNPDGQNFVGNDRLLIDVESHDDHDIDLTRQCADAAHVARHNPERVLAEVAAKRAVLDCWRNWRVQYEVMADMRARSLSPTKPAPTDSENRAMDYSDALWMAVERLAASYADQPGYRDEWKIQ